MVVVAYIDKSGLFLINATLEVSETFQSDCMFAVAHAEFAVAYARFAVYQALLALVLAMLSTVPPPPPVCSTKTNFCVASS